MKEKPSPALDFFALQPGPHLIQSLVNRDYHIHHDTGSGQAHVNRLPERLMHIHTTNFLCSFLFNVTISFIMVTFSHNSYRVTKS
jgi:hypothetical protein